MNYPRIKYKDMGLVLGTVIRETDKKGIYISEALKNSPKGLKKAIRGHERVHFRMKNNFLNDCLGLKGAKLDRIIPDLIERHKRGDLKQRLEKEDKNHDSYLVTLCEIAGELSGFSREAVNLIAYCEAPDRDTKNWIASIYSIEDEIGNFLLKKTQYPHYT